MSPYHALFLLIIPLINAKESDDWKNLEKKTIGKKGEIIFEHDIIISPSEARRAVESGEIRTDVAKEIKASDKGKPMIGKITAPKNWRWEKGVVPYVINKRLRCKSKFTCFFGGAELSIRKAMKEWEKHTCIRFREKNDNDKDFVHFVSSSISHCAAHIGRVGGEQFVYLGMFCRNYGVILHEIGHTLGFFHEQSRPDRDDYITIKWNRIRKAQRGNFKKYKVGQISDMGFPYDYDSIMHYGKRDFSKWILPETIKPKMPGKKIGQRKRLSKIDIAEMNAYYQCIP